MGPMTRQSAPAATAPPEWRDGFTQANGLPAVPIVLGVVGHRDVRAEDRDALKSALTAIFRQFREAYGPTPLVVLSSLAEGADQLAAEAALEVDDGVFVRAPLPFPPETSGRSCPAAVGLPCAMAARIRVTSPMGGGRRWPPTRPRPAPEPRRSGRSAGADGDVDP